MRNISKKIFMEFVFFTIIFLVMVVSNNFIVNSASTKEISLPQVQEYREIDKDKYRLDGANGTAPKIRENLYQISNTQIEGFVKSKNYLPGRIDPFGNTAATEQTQNTTDTSKDGNVASNSSQQAPAQSSTPATAPANPQTDTTTANTTTTNTTTNNNNPITSDNADTLNLKDFPKK